MGNTCKPMAVSFQCMTKFTTKKKKEKKKNNDCITCLKSYFAWETLLNTSHARWCFILITNAAGVSIEIYILQTVLSEAE